MSETGHDCVDVKWYRDCPICRIDTLIAERDRLREQNNLLRQKIDNYKSASLLEISGDPADIEPHHIEDEITKLREQVRELEAEVQHRTEWENHYRADFVEAGTQLTTAKEALEEIISYCESVLTKGGLSKSKAYFIATEALAKLDGEVKDD